MPLSIADIDWLTLSPAEQHPEIEPRHSAVNAGSMHKELKSLYKLKAKLLRHFGALTAAMPEKRALDHVAALIRLLEHQPSASDKVISLPNKRPRTLVNHEERQAILDWLFCYFRMNNNQATGFHQLTALMLADGIRIPAPADKQLFVISGLVTRNKMFKGKNSLWHLAEFAA